MIVDVGIVFDPGSRKILVLRDPLGGEHDVTFPEFYGREQEDISEYLGGMLKECSRDFKRLDVGITNIGVVSRDENGSDMSCELGVYIAHIGEAR